MSRYRKEYPIGRGGMGEVFRATRVLDDGHESPVACKAMRVKLRNDKGERLFLREASVGLEVGHNHPNVVSVFDLLAYTAPDGERTLYLVMELVEGVDLADLLEARERLSFDMLRCIARDALAGLCFLHGRQVLHRDLSPSNVLVSQSGVAKIADLGVAKFASADGRQSTDLHGKAAYAAPELGAGRLVDARSDMFAFGASLYHLLTGHGPFGSSFDEIVGKRYDWDIEDLPADIPADLRALVLGLLKKKPDEREPQTVAEALAMLETPAEGTPAALGAIVAELYAPRVERWQRHQRERAKVAEPAEYIEAAPVLEGFADTVRTTAEADDSVDGQKTEIISEGSSRRTPGIHGDGANGQQVSAKRSRLALAVVLAIAAVLALAFIGDVQIGSDSRAPIVWQLLQQNAPTGEQMPADGAQPTEPTTAEADIDAAQGEDPRPTAQANIDEAAPAGVAEAGIDAAHAEKPRPTAQATSKAAPVAIAEAAPESRTEQPQGEEPRPPTSSTTAEGTPAPALARMEPPASRPPGVQTASATTAIHTARAATSHQPYTHAVRGPGSRWSGDWLHWK